MKKLSTLLPVLFLFSILLATPLFAQMGVGVGLGKINVTQKLKQGMQYTLPTLTVFNTGDITGEYTVDIAYHEGQEQLLPPADWFKFDPPTFQLEPGESKNVDIQLSIPVNNVIPGDYFAYIEGKPSKNIETEETVIGIAAASKLNFTVEESSFIQGIYYRTLSLYNTYKPYSTIVLIFIALLIPYVILKRTFDFNLSVKKKESR